MASDDRFDITIVGSGGHAGYPHQTLDALMVAAGLVTQLQTLVSRRVDPRSRAAVTGLPPHGGDAYNAIAGTTQLSGTVRTFEPAGIDHRSYV